MVWFGVVRNYPVILTKAVAADGLCLAVLLGFDLGLGDNIAAIRRDLAR